MRLVFKSVTDPCKPYERRLSQADVKQVTGWVIWQNLMFQVFSYKGKPATAPNKNGAKFFVPHVLAVSMWVSESPTWDPPVPHTVPHMKGWPLNMKRAILQQAVAEPVQSRWHWVPKEIFQLGIHTNHQTWGHESATGPLNPLRIHTFRPVPSRRPPFQPSGRWSSILPQPLVRSGAGRTAGQTGQVLESALKRCICNIKTQ